jgi:hypothetical protein
MTSMELLLEIFLAYLPTLVLFAIWYFFSTHRNFRTYFSLGLFVMLVILGSIGFFEWQESLEISRLGSVILNTSLLWMTGPLMFAVVRNNKTIIVVPLLCVILPIASSFLCFFLLLVTNQIWGL